MLEVPLRKVLPQLVEEYSELIDIKAKYYELIFHVSCIIPGETRHETALRYIKQAENQCNPPAENRKV